MYEKADLIFWSFMQEQCWGCGFYFASYDGPVHRYGVASPACWATFNEVIAQEATYFDGYPPIHRLLVDAYAIQHPPHHELQQKFAIAPRFVAASIQSIAVHLIALYAALGKKIALEKIAPIMDRVLSTGVVFKELEAPATFGEISINDIKKARNAEEHIKVVTCWAECSWKAWSKHHEQVASWYEEYSR
jgi:hypothetical protein